MGGSLGTGRKMDTLKELKISKNYTSIAEETFKPND